MLNYTSPITYLLCFSVGLILLLISPNYRRETVIGLVEFLRSAFFMLCITFAGVVFVQIGFWMLLAVKWIVKAVF